ncbi:MAG: translation initiation factor IF-3 [Candidatus Margulisbacteria bacterium]|nr:translation initiation factor IF-3 [Candidatus Margulisiibacteriota bacterium]
MRKIKPNELLNQYIHAEKVKLILDDGQQVVLAKSEALAQAKEAGLDLFLVSPNAEPPVAKILDYGQYRYKKEKKQKDANKKSNNKTNVLKELKLTPRIGQHDFAVRLKHGREFLTKGYKVKLTVFFKGREGTHPELGHALIAQYLEQIADLGWTDSPTLTPRLLGRQMSIVIVPGRKRIMEVATEIQSAVPETKTKENENA